jgi:hypothetical protein
MEKASLMFALICASMPGSVFVTRMDDWVWFVCLNGRYDIDQRATTGSFQEHSSIHPVYIKYTSILSPFIRIWSIISVVQRWTGNDWPHNSAEKLINEHCLHGETSLKPWSPWRLLPTIDKVKFDIIAASRQASSDTNFGLPVLRIGLPVCSWVSQLDFWF